MAISFIQQVLDAKAKVSTEETLISTLIKNLGKYYPERSHKTVHASDVTKAEFCPRQYRLMDILGLKQPDTYINTALRATFDLGSMVAERLVEDWMGGRAYGKWVCRKCEHTIAFGTRPIGHKCGAVGDCDYSYREINFFGESSGISGSLDLIAYLGGSKMIPVELKTIKTEDFDKLAAPLAEHRLRTRLYLKLIEDSQNPIRFQLDTDKAKILYVSKGFGKMHPDYGQILPFKEYDVQRDDQSIELYLARGTLVKQCRVTETIPISKVCDSVTCTTAKRCLVKSQCWSGAYQ